METKASHLAAGSFVVILLVALIAAAFWFSPNQEQNKVTFYDILFADDVTGLQIDSVVRYRGVQVGKVDNIVLDHMHNDQVRVTIRVNEDISLKEDTMASLESQGITGIAYVLLDGGSLDAKLLPKTVKKPFTQITAKPGKLQAVLQGVPGLVADANIVLDDLHEILTGVKQIVPQQSDPKSDQISNILRNVEVISQNLTTVSTTMTQVIEAERMNKLFDQGTNAMTGVNNMSKDFHLLSQDLRTTSKSLTEVSANLVLLIKDLREVSGGTTGYEFNQLIPEVRQLIASLQRISTKFERDPAKFLFGDQRKGVSNP
ncbi:MAG: MlaD family protein [Alphaproteobacteria bacterium]|nr:MlaD family protein [Alphaproteobacteria bacterium]